MQLVRGVSKNIFVNYALLGFFLFSIIFLGAYRIGPLSVRNYVSFASIIYLLSNIKSIRIDIGFRWYVIYVVTIIFLGFLNKDYQSIDFWRTIFGYHIVCILLYLTLSVFIKTKEHISQIIRILLLFYIFNCAVSIFQFKNIYIGWVIGQIINPDVTSRLIDYESQLLYSDSFLNLSIIAGICGFVVANGYFLATYLPIVSRPIWNSGKKNFILGSLILTIAVVTSYMIQQRMAFILIISYVLFIIYRRLNFLTKIFLIIIFIVICLFSSGLDIDMGRLTLDQSNEDRIELFQQFNSFLESGNIICGGYSDYLTRFGGIGQHNTFLDAWTRSGLIGLFIYLILYIMIFFKSIVVAYQSYLKKDHVTATCSFACIIYLLYSTTHSTGLQSGDILFWLPYVLMVFSFNLGKSDNRQMAKL